jgi:hypothetical protein
MTELLVRALLSFSTSQGKGGIKTRFKPNVTMRERFYDIVLCVGNIAWVVHLVVRMFATSDGNQRSRSTYRITYLQK